MMEESAPLVGNPPVEARPVETPPVGNPPVGTDQGLGRAGEGSHQNDGIQSHQNDALKVQKELYTLKGLNTPKAKENPYFLSFFKNIKNETQ